MLPQSAAIAAAQTKTTKIGHTQKLVMFCSKLFVEFWWLNMQNWFCHLNLAQSSELFSPFLPHNLFFQSQVKEKSEKSWNNAEKCLKKRKITGHKMSLILPTAPPLSFTVDASRIAVIQMNDYSTAQEETQTDDHHHFLCVCRANINFVHVNVCINGTISGLKLLQSTARKFPTHVKCRNCRWKPQKKKCKRNTAQIFFEILICSIGRR